MNSNTSAHRHPNKSRPLRRPGTGTPGEVNPFDAAAATFDGFLASVGQAAHDTRMMLLLMTGVHGNVLGVGTAERVLHWFDLLTEIERQADGMYDRYTQTADAETIETNPTPSL